PTTKEVQAIEKKANAVNLKLLKAKLRHLGTEQNLIVMTNINKWLKKRLEMRFKTEMVDVIIEANEVKGIVLKNGEKLYSKNIILALGREGATSLVKLCQKHDLKMTNNQVDIGVRVETSNAVMKEINTHLYEGKFVYKTSLNTEVRTFCSNPSGHVVIENHNGTAVVNGHAFRDPKLGTDNTNFALLVSHRFTAPFNEPNEFAHAVANLANKLAVGGVIVQRYGDFINGKRTSKEGLEKNIIIPSLKEAIAGDLSLVLPYKTMQSLIEMMTVLDKITPGIASAETLFYGVEAKFYSARPEIDNNFETNIKGLYMAGDGAGLTRGLAQAGANGVFLAREIINKKEKD
ncbi:MAG: FAD-dependent oxidoreductase, partial [Acholeplasmataceae bacterium]|nr:FAD-dependent oxidoreductase [Acholeplasmataceae bacterium]